MNNSDDYALYRSMVQTEDEQVHRRLSWLGAFQGFLFAALGFSWGKDPNLPLVICGLGFAVASLVFAGIFISALATRRTRILWLKKKPRDYKGPDIFGFYPQWARFTHFLTPELLLPLVFGVAWICVCHVIFSSHPSPRPNQTVQRTASPPAIYFMSVCHPTLLAASHACRVRDADFPSR
jgi:hypothetical protein